MKFIFKKSQGFSVIEMTLASFLVLSISAISYKVLTSQTNKQIASIQNQKNDSLSQTVLTRFKADTALIDPTWVRYGVSPIYPHQGYGLGQNYYALTSGEKKDLAPNDAVTFLRRDPQNGRLYVPVGSTTRICNNGNMTSTDQYLIGQNIRLDSVADLQVNDWILIYQAGHYALGVIDLIDATQVSVGGTSTSGSDSIDNSTNQNQNNSPSSGSVWNGEQEAANQQEMNEIEESAQLQTSDKNSRYISVSGGGGTNSSAVVLSGGSIRLRAPNISEYQNVINNTAGYSTGFVSKPGIVPANFDYFGTTTSTADDNTFCFETAKSNIQKVLPVTYSIEYRTSDGSSKSSANAYVLDKAKGNQIKMLVRSEYINGTQKKEYLAPIDDLGFTYDLIDRSSGTTQIARDVGRSKQTIGLLNLNNIDLDVAQANFITNNQIVSLKMKIGYMAKDPETRSTEVKQSREIKVALDPSIQQDAYRTKATILSSKTDDLNTIAKNKSDKSTAANEQLGKPLFIPHGSNSNNSEVVVPVSTFLLNSDGGLDSSSQGALYVYNPDGCAVNGKSDCDPSNNKSSIRFTLGSDKKFFPNTLSQVEVSPEVRRIYVGGVTMQNYTDENGRAAVKRISGVGVITLTGNETLAQKMDSSAGTGSCSIANCNWYEVDQHDPENAELVDTALLATDPVNPNELYVAPMTKRAGELSQSFIYKGVWNQGQFSYDKFAAVSGTENGKIISAISDRPITINNEDYLAVCVTKKMSSSCGGECLKEQVPDTLTAKTVSDTLSDSGVKQEGESSGPRSLDTIADTLGEIQLVKQGSGLNDEPGIVLTRHNYRCSAINIDPNGNMIVSGRLTVQPIPYNSVKKAIEYKSAMDKKDIPLDQQDEFLKNNVMYLDEAIVSDGAQTIYADYYQVDPATYANAGNAMFIGWQTGMSTVEFSDGTFGMVTGNKYRTSKESVVSEFSNAGISKIELAGMKDRVVATIETDPTNINNSIISATYTKRSNELPSVYIPGFFWVDKAAKRTTPTPLPSISPAMSETSWFQLYQSLISPMANSGLNSAMPVLSDTYGKYSESCLKTKPKTCS